eukprot:gene8209-biopygen1570
MRGFPLQWVEGWRVHLGARKHTVLSPSRILHSKVTLRSRIRCYGIRQGHTPVEHTVLWGPPEARSGRAYCVMGRKVTLRSSIRCYGIRQSHAPVEHAVLWDPPKSGSGRVYGIMGSGKVTLRSSIRCYGIRQSHASVEHTVLWDPPKSRSGRACHQLPSNPPLKATPVTFRRKIPGPRKWSWRKGGGAAGGGLLRPGSKGSGEGAHARRGAPSAAGRTITSQHPHPPRDPPGRLPNRWRRRRRRTLEKKCGGTRGNEKNCGTTGAAVGEACLTTQNQCPKRHPISTSRLANVFRGTVGTSREKRLGTRPERERRLHFISPNSVTPNTLVFLEKNPPHREKRQWAPPGRRNLKQRAPELVHNLPPCPAARVPQAVASSAPEHRVDSVAPVTCTSPVR